MSQKEIGLDTFAVTVPFLDSGTGKKIDVINNIQYYRSSKKSNRKNDISDEQKSLLRRILKSLKMIGFIFFLYRICKNKKPDIIHAHAMFFCGIPALLIGRILKLPTFYEVRSIWVLPKDGKHKSYFHRLVAKVLLKLEIFTMKSANKVFVVNDNLKQTLVSFGVPEEHMTVVKNAVNTSLIVEKIKKARNENSPKKVTFGYIGSITSYEGIPFMIKSIEELSKIRDDFRFVIYGSVRDPREKQKILDTIEECSMSKYVFCKGSVPPSEIHKVYNEIDIVVNPRLKNTITDTVTPLKPLEAMAYGKVFVGSDVGGIKELLKDSDQGIFFKADSVDDLVKTLDSVGNMSQKELNLLGHKSREFVVREKSWIHNAKIYKKEYLNF